MAKLLPTLGLTYDDVSLVPQYSTVKSRDDVDISVELVKGITLKVPLVSSNQECLINEEFCEKLWECGGIAMIHQFMSVEQEVAMLTKVKAKGAKVGASAGVRGNFMDRVSALVDAGVDILLMDTPHAHSTNMIDAIKKIRKEFPTLPIMAGTVATKEGVEALAEAGANSIKYGIGAGAGCLTRVNAGVGIPQFSAVMLAADTAKRCGVSLIADAGVKSPGDFAKAIGAGATAIQACRIFTGTDEANSEFVEKDGVKCKIYMGSASEEAKALRAKNDPDFVQEPTKYIEGTGGLVPYEGSLESVVEKYAHGLRSAMSYSGAHTIEEFQRKATFVQVTVNGAIEAGHRLIK
jgi:IMP dehydrogenase/GMP reductase